MTNTNICGQRTEFNKILTSNERKILDNSLQIKLSCSKIKHLLNKKNISLDIAENQEFDNIIESANKICNIINLK
jgi:hypothetical protein